MAINSVRKLFDLSLSAESEAERFYSLLAARFSSHVEVSAFFVSMQRDEQEHISDILSIRDSLPGERLKEDAPPRAVELASGFLRFSAEESIAKVGDLEDAYRLTVNIEFSEVNRLHELLAELFGPSDEFRRNIMKSINRHLEKVKEFQNSTGSTSDRRQIPTDPA